MKTIDLTDLPSGGRYEDRYGAYLKIFQDICETRPDEKIIVVGAPWCWTPLLWHLNCNFSHSRQVFKHCTLVREIMSTHVLDRTAVEVLCGFRPETVDALWKCDMQWMPNHTRVYQAQKEFIVTNNGSYHRQEVNEFRHRLLMYQPDKRHVVLVPCAADKPYPAAMHQAVLDIMPSSYYMANVTGVLGIVPQDMWEVMPHYDSGIPNEWRLFETVRKYFQMHCHDRIVVYCDYYGPAIFRALESIGQLERAVFVNPVRFYYDYIDLLTPARLEALKQAFVIP